MFRTCSTSFIKGRKVRQSLFSNLAASDTPTNNLGFFELSSTPLLTSVFTVFVSNKAKFEQLVFILSFFF